MQHTKPFITFYISGPILEYIKLYTYFQEFQYYF